MRKIWIIIGIIILLFFGGCVKKWEYEGVTYSAPNWTADGKIVFIEYHYIQKWEKIIPVVSEHQSGGTEEISVYEINNNGSGLRKVAVIDSNEFESGPELAPVSTSSAGNWVVLSIEDWRRGEHYPVIYIVKRNGDSLKEVGSGTYPDFSPDASKIVYEKPNQGIWIMNRDGTNDHCIVPDSSAKYPAWSPDDTLIAYVSYIDTPWAWGIHIIKTDGDSSKFYATMEYPKWSKFEKNILYCTQYMQGLKIDIESSVIESLAIRSGQGVNPGWNSQWFIGYDGSWFVIKKDGTNKWYLKEKIQGGK